MKLIAFVVTIASLSPIVALAQSRLVPMPPVHYEIGDSMTSDEVLNLAAKEYTALQTYVAKYGEQPGTAELRAAADAHFAEGTRRLAAEVKAALNPETPEEAFRRGVEELGKEVAEILKNGGKAETPEKAFRREVEALAAEVTSILASGTIGSQPSPSINEILSNGSIGNNGGRDTPSAGGKARPAAPSSGMKPAAGAGWAGALGRD